MPDSPDSPWMPEAPDPPWTPKAPDPPWPPDLPAPPWVPERTPPWRSPVQAQGPVRTPERPPPLPFRCYTARDAPIGGGGDVGNVRLCLPFPCVSTPIYGLSFVLSLVHSSPSVFDLLLTWCCFPWLCYVFISPEFSPSLCPSSRLCSCVSCLPSLKSHYSFYLLSPVSFPQHDCDSHAIQIS